MGWWVRKGDILKIIVEVLQKENTLSGEIFNVVKSETLDFGEVKKLNIDSAKQKVSELRSQLSNNYKIRVTEYHNDETDESRKPCKILYEE